MVVYPQLSDGRQQGEEEKEGEEEDRGLCRLVISNFWTNSNAAMSLLQGLLVTRANQRRRRVGSPAS